MTKNELIGKQQLEFEDLKERVISREEDLGKIYRHLFDIGGPLNGDKLGYSREQLKIFHNIATLADFGDWEFE